MNKIDEMPRKYNFTKAFLEIEILSRLIVIKEIENYIFSHLNPQSQIVSEISVV